MSSKASTHFGPRSNPKSHSPASSTHPKRIISIPNELLIPILGKLTNPTLAICARTSRVLHAIATPLLYHTLEIDFNKDINPVFTRTGPSDRTPWSAASKAAKLEAEREGVAAYCTGEEPDQGFVNRMIDLGDDLPNVGQLTLSSPQYQPQSQSHSPTLAPLPDRFSFVTYLTITSHTHDTCANLPPLIMPLLHELRIRAIWQQNHLDFCECQHINDSSGRCPQRPACICQLVSQLRPRRLVIGGRTTGLTGSAIGLSKRNFPYPPPWIRELVIFAGVCTGIEIGPEAGAMWLDKVPPTVQKLSIIMEPEDWADEPRWNFRRVAGFEGRIDPGRLWKRLGQALSGGAVVIEMVGIEKIDRDWSELPIKAEEDEVRRALKAALVGKGWKVKDAEERSRELGFVGREAFDKRRSAQGRRGRRPLPKLPGC